MNKQQIRADKWLQRLMFTGVPVAAVSLLCLWSGWFFSIPALGSVFITTMAIALLLGFAYNIRFLILSLRARRDTESAEQAGESSKDN